MQRPDAKLPDEVSVVFATPTFSMQPAMEYAASLSSTFYKLSERKVNVAIRFRPGLCFVDVARNFLITEFLEDSKADDLFFLDDDVGWPPDKVVEFLERPEEVLCGVYPKRQDELDFPTILAFDDKKRVITRDNKLVEALFVPFGFVRLKRSACEKLAENATRYVFPDPKNPNGGKREIYDIFGMGPTGTGDYHGEDGWFCERWRKLGGRIWLDPDIEFSHRGTNTWRASYLPSLRNYIAAQAPADPVSPADLARDLLKQHQKETA